MESKYQEALDRLCENNYFDEKGNCNCDLIVMDRILLQELVDNAGNYFEDEYELVKQYIEQLEQVLDKACEELETFDMTFNDGDFVDIKNKEQWKEWLKEDVEQRRITKI